MIAVAELIAALEDPKRTVQPTDLWALDALGYRVATTRIVPAALTADGAVAAGVPPLDATWYPRVIHALLLRQEPAEERGRALKRVNAAFVVLDLAKAASQGCDDLESSATARLEQLLVR